MVYTEAVEYNIEFSWGEHLETCCNKIKTTGGVVDLISRLQSGYNANTTTENFSAKIWEFTPTRDEKLIYDGIINQYVIDGFRYNHLKEMISND